MDYNGLSSIIRLVNHICLWLPWRREFLLWILLYYRLRKRHPHIMKELIMDYLVFGTPIICRDACSGSAEYCDYYCGQCEIFSDTGACCGQGGRMPVRIGIPN